MSDGVGSGQRLCPEFAQPLSDDQRLAHRGHLFGHRRKAALGLVGTLGSVALGCGQSVHPLRSAVCCGTDGVKLGR